MMKVAFSFIIGLSRPIVVAPLVICGYIIFQWFNGLQKRVLYLLSTLVLLCIIAGILRWKVTLVILVSIPFFTAYVLGLSVTIGLLAVCRLLTNTPLERFFSWWGKYSVFVMVTHEYLGLRGTIQSLVGRILGDYTISVIITFIVVIMIEWVLIRFDYIPIKSRLMR